LKAANNRVQFRSACTLDKEIALSEINQVYLIMPSLTIHYYLSIIMKLNKRTYTAILFSSNCNMDEIANALAWVYKALLMVYVDITVAIRAKGKVHADEDVTR